jgi:phosphohistidine phosphatase
VEHRLVLMRHAKSGYPESTPDHERPLAARGARDAPRIGAWLRESGNTPDLVVCSTAVRARQTWELATAALREQPPVRYEPRVYEASTLGLLMLIREFPEDMRTVLVVGHNPAISQLASGLAERSDLPAFPTAGLAVLTVDGQWTTTSPGEAKLDTFTTPRDL